MTKSKNIETKIIFTFISILFLLFLVVPIVKLFAQSFLNNGLSINNYIEVIKADGFLQSLRNSFVVSFASSAVSVILAFILSYTINYTNLPSVFKKIVKQLTLLPMLLPTITYGFAIIYSLGKQGFITRIFGRQIIEIYGFNGLLIGYVIYTLPISFLLIQNTMMYIDKKYTVVSRLMGDNNIKNFFVTVFRPLINTLAASFIQCFFLSFTDYGIPAAVGGKYNTVATVLYNEMLGSIPDFGKGAAIAVLMLIPSIIGIIILQYIEKYNVRYTKISKIEIKKSLIRDTILGILSSFILICILSVFLIIFIIPIVKSWPYNLEISFEHLLNIIADKSLIKVYINSLIVAIITAILGTIVVYGASLVTARSTLSNKLKKVIEKVALVTNTIPGMVIGIAYLLVFAGTPISGTFLIIILCNVIHFFSTPYLMIKNSLLKINSSWENTAKLMGDSYLKTIVRIITPNIFSSLIEAFSYYFINAMVTVSAVIFIATAKTMVITAKIKELQYFEKFSEIFVLSIFILLTNLLAKLIFKIISNIINKKGRKNEEEV